MIALDINALVKHYPGAVKRAVDGLSLTIEKGEFFGLLGPNGAGKTTSISAVSGLLKPDSGAITIFGQQPNTTEAKISLGVVPQDIALYDTLTARENLRFFGAMYGLKGNQFELSVASLLDRFGLLARADDMVQTFSGGMKRRVNLMAALLHQPKLLILDEPTVGVDVQSRAMINDYLTELNQGGTTILYTGHHLDEAEKLCSRIVIVDHGRAIAEGSPASLKHQYDCQRLEDVFIKLTGRELRDSHT